MSPEPPKRSFIEKFCGMSEAQICEGDSPTIVDQIGHIGYGSMNSVMPRVVHLGNGTAILVGETDPSKIPNWAKTDLLDTTGSRAVRMDTQWRKLSDSINRSSSEYSLVLSRADEIIRQWRELAYSMGEKPRPSGIYQSVREGILKVFGFR